MDFENTPFQGEKTFIPIGPDIFERTEALVSTISNEKNREILEESIRRGKRLAFEYAEQVLEELSQKGRKITEEGPRHGLFEAFSEMLIDLEISGYQFGDPKKKQRRPIELESAAFQYALQKARAYEEALKERKSKEEILKELGLEKLVHPEYLEMHILEKFRALPPEIRENIFRVTK